MSTSTFVYLYPVRLYLSMNMYIENCGSARLKIAELLLRDIILKIVISKLREAIGTSKFEICRIAIAEAATVFKTSQTSLHT